MFKLLNKVNEGYLEGFGLFQYTKRREVINLTWSKNGFNLESEFGFTGNITYSGGIFLGVTVWRLSIWLQMFGETVDYSDPYANDIEY
jgi:hypothetical protein